MTKSKKNAYYEANAYRPDHIPAQNPHTGEKSYFSTEVRLPWGDTQQVIPTEFMEGSNPNRMRFWEKVETTMKEQLTNGTYTAPYYERTDVHLRYNHEVFRFALLPFISQLWIYMLQLGKLDAFCFHPYS